MRSAKLLSWILVLSPFAYGCIGFVPPAGQGTISAGGTSAGVLRRGVELPARGRGFVRARPGDPARYGTPRLVAALTRGAAAVAEELPGGAPLRVGDLSSPGGGRHHRHHSHRSGRDADVIFYALNGEGRSMRGRGWVSFDRFGIGRSGQEPVFFDDARNWHFVRTLLLDPEAQVQWIFCSRGIKARLLAYAARHETNPEAIFRAAWVLHQPSSGNPHADHFHVRIACSGEEISSGCHNVEPIWPWLRKAAEKPALASPKPLNDGVLLTALLSDDAETPATANRLVLSERGTSCSVFTD